jgi:hypothetical protein
MKKTMTKMMLRTAVLVGVAAVSYAAGAAKAKVAIVTGRPRDQMGAADGRPAADREAVGRPRQGSRIRDAAQDAGGADSGMHAHTADYHAVSIQGTWVHTVEGDATSVKDLPVGSYVFQPGKLMHQDVCKGKQDCIVFVHQHGKGDFIPAKKPAGDKAAAPAAPAAPAAAPRAPPAGRQRPPAPADVSTKFRFPLPATAGRGPGEGPVGQRERRRF